MKMPTTTQIARTILILGLTPIVVVIPFAVLYGAANILDQEEVRSIMKLGLFGIWSLVCIAVGGWMTHRRAQGMSPIPGFDVNEMFNWMRTGKTAPEDESESAPIEQKVSTFNF